MPKKGMAGMADKAGKAEAGPAKEVGIAIPISACMVFPVTGLGTGTDTVKICSKLVGYLIDPCVSGRSD